MDIKNSMQILYNTWQMQNQILQNTFTLRLKGFVLVSYRYVNYPKVVRMINEKDVFE